MNNYITITIEMDSSSAVTSKLDNIILKDSPFTAKYKVEKKIVYENILLELHDYNAPDQDFMLIYADFVRAIDASNALAMDASIQYSIYLKLKDILPVVRQLSIWITSGIISDKDIKIFYSDGSCDKNSKMASYGCCELLKEDSTGVRDDFTGKTMLYETFSGTMPGTNNVGELTGIKECLRRGHENKYQLIISDSEYSLKCFREWIYNWKSKGYKNAAGKTIENKELILETENLQKTSPAVCVLYKWTRGHEGNTFNEICDRIAKERLGKK